MGTCRSIRLGARDYRERLQKAGWTLHGSLRASKLIAGRPALMFIQRAPENRDVMTCTVMWRASSAAIHGAWRSEAGAR